MSSPFKVLTMKEKASLKLTTASAMMEKIRKAAKKPKSAPKPSVSAAAPAAGGGGGDDGIPASIALTPAKYIKVPGIARGAAGGAEKVPLLPLSGSYTSAFYGYRNDEGIMYEDVTAMLNNEKAFVQRCMVNAKSIVFVRRIGKTPFILFGDIGEKRIVGNVEKRCTYLDETLGTDGDTLDLAGDVEKLPGMFFKITGSYEHLQALLPAGTKIKKTNAKGTQASAVKFLTDKELQKLTVDHMQGISAQIALGASVSASMSAMPLPLIESSTYGLTTMTLRSKKRSDLDVATKHAAAVKVAAMLYHSYGHAGLFAYASGFDVRVAVSTPENKKDLKAMLTAPETAAFIKDWYERAFEDVVDDWQTVSVTNVAESKAQVETAYKPQIAQDEEVMVVKTLDPVNDTTLQSIVAALGEGSALLSRRGHRVAICKVKKTNAKDRCVRHQGQVFATVERLATLDDEDFVTEEQ